MWQPTEILYPDVELVLTGVLRPLVTSRSGWSDVYVSNTMPTKADGTPTRKDRMVIVRNDGGPALGDARSLARVGINVYGATGQQATDLANLVVALLGGLGGTSSITAVPTVSIPSVIADGSGQERRYLTAEIHFRGSSL